MKHFNLSPLFVLLAFFIGANSASAQKMKPEDVLAKHLDSIGSKENLAKIKNQAIFSDVEVAQKGNTSEMKGKAVFLSSGEKNIWGMSLNSNDYPQDKFGFNGRDTKVAFSTPGARSILGDFIYTHTELLKEGLLGGTLSTSWALLDTDSRKPKLSYEGTKKLKEKEVHVLSYSPKKGSDLNIKMYFDANTYQHLRTEYSRLVQARTGATVDGAGRQGEDRFRLVEEFSDFKKAGNLNLPSKYTLSYSYTSSSSIRFVQNGNREIEWKFNVTNFSYNQELAEQSFDIASN